MDDLNEQLGERMRKASAKCGMSIADVTAKMDMKHCAVSHYFNGRNEPKLRTLIRFSEPVGVPVHDLLTPQSDVLKNQPGTTPNLNDTTTIYPYDLTQSDERYITEITFQRHWCLKKNISPEDAALVHVFGEAMAPTLPGGSLVMIDTRKTNIEPKRLYACFYSGQIWVRELEHLADQNVLVRGDSLDITTLVVAIGKGHEFKVLGKDVWISRALQQPEYMVQPS